MMKKGIETALLIVLASCVLPVVYYKLPYKITTERTLRLGDDNEQGTHYFAE